MAGKRAWNSNFEGAEGRGEVWCVSTVYMHGTDASDYCIRVAYIINHLFMERMTALNRVGVDV